MIASVIVDVKAKQVNRSFDYLVPPHLENVIKFSTRSALKITFALNESMHLVLLSLTPRDQMDLGVFFALITDISFLAHP